MEKNEPNWDLVVINPYMTIGPQLNAAMNNSNELLQNIMTGKLPAIRPLIWGGVDVRDVAKAHILPIRSLEGWLGSKLARMITYTLPKGTGTYLRTHLNRSANISTNKIKGELAMSFRPTEETLLETCEFLKRTTNQTMRRIAEHETTIENYKMGIGVGFSACNLSLIHI